MANLFKKFIFVFIFTKTCFAGFSTSNLYYLKPMLEQENNLKFKFVKLADLGFSPFDAGEIQCGSVCNRCESCRSFYAKNGGCVFGVSDDVMPLKNSVEVTPEAGQMMKTKNSNYTVISRASALCKS